jgi:hypothetical protein
MQRRAAIATQRRWDLLCAMCAITTKRMPGTNASREFRGYRPTDTGCGGSGVRTPAMSSCQHEDSGTQIRRGRDVHSLRHEGKEAVLRSAPNNERTKRIRALARRVSSLLRSRCRLLPRAQTNPKVTGSQDFSRLQQLVPGPFFVVGVRDHRSRRDEA